MGGSLGSLSEMYELLRPQSRAPDYPDSFLSLISIGAKLQYSAKDYDCDWFVLSSVLALSVHEY